MSDDSQSTRPARRPAEQGKFLTMVAYGKVYPTAVQVVDRALAAGATHRQVADELAFLLAAVCVQGDIDLEVTKRVLDQVQRVQASAAFYSAPPAGDA